MKKRILALLLALCMLVCVLPAAVADDDAQAAYRAYLAWLTENREALDGYVWQYEGWQSQFTYDAEKDVYTKNADAETTVRAVTIADLDDDGIPELVYVGDVKEPIGSTSQSKLNILTYRNGAVQPLYSDVFDTPAPEGTTRSFSFFTRSGSKGLFVLRTETTAQGTAERYDVVQSDGAEWKLSNLIAKTANLVKHPAYFIADTIPDALYQLPTDIYHFSRQFR